MHSRIAKILRWVPFAAGTATSLWVAAGLPHGRKPFEIDLTLSRESLALSMGKVPHYLSIALLFGLACVATGLRRPALAFIRTDHAGRLRLGACREHRHRTHRASGGPGPGPGGSPSMPACPPCRPMVVAQTRQ